MAISRNQFSVLVALEKKRESLSQRELAEKTDLSVGTVNKVMTELFELNYVSDKITDKGIEALEPYRVKKAFFLAAGFGSRLIPITLNTPKPLIKVNGTRMIDTMLDALNNIGITDITIVRGYLSEQFDQLLYKYPHIKFINNTKFSETNNISSAMLIKDNIDNAYIMEADLVLFNKNLLTKYQYSSNYLGVPVETTDDWCLHTKSGRIIKMSIGGTNCYHMYGVSYWTEEDGKKLSKHMEKVFKLPGGKERYWDQVALEYFIDEYSISVRPCSFNDIVEIDSFSELKIIDKAYDC